MSKSYRTTFGRQFYVTKDLDSNLRQGDLISIEKLWQTYGTMCRSETGLANLYPYFFGQYRYCSVATQCCDIEHNKVACIQLIALKPWINVLKEFSLKKGALVNPSGKIVTIKKNKRESIFNAIVDFHSHNTKLNFYYPYLKGVLPHDYAACLDVSVSMRITCKDALLAARVASIGDQYRHKLASQLGTLYNRVGLDGFDKVLKLDKDKLVEFFADHYQNYLVFEK